MSEALTCARCGYTAEVVLAADDRTGREMTAAEYLAAIKMTGREILCGRCAIAAPPTRKGQPLLVTWEWRPGGHVLGAVLSGRRRQRDGQG